VANYTTIGESSINAANGVALSFSNGLLTGFNIVGGSGSISFSDCPS